MSEPTAPHDERTFVDAHGVVIHCYVWSAPSPRGAVQIAHGVGEYALRYAPLAERLVAAGYTVYADDHRGHGRTGLGQHGGDRARLGRLGPGGTDAAAAAVLQLSTIAHAELPGVPLAMLGHSWGSLLVQRLLNRGTDPWDAVVLSGTAFRTLRHMNGGDLSRRHRPPGGGHGAEWLSRDTAIGEAFIADELTFDAKVAKLFGVAEAAKLLGRPGRIDRDLPMLLQVGSEDPLGGPRSVELLAAAYRRIGGLSDVTVQVYEGARHEVYNETNRDEVIADLVAWLDAKLPTTARHVSPAPDAGAGPSTPS